MKAQDLRDIASRLLRLADELDGIKSDGGSMRNAVIAVLLDLGLPFLKWTV